MLETGEKIWSAKEFEVKFPQYLFQTLTYVELNRGRKELTSIEKQRARPYNEVIKLHLQKLSRQSSVASGENSSSPLRLPH